jgi:NADH-quinone oxidoreductase subunit F/NAD(P)H dehydrogenase (quinone)/NADP-reducing hydrogenase subunit HndC
LELLVKICDGRGEPEDIAAMEDLSVMIKETALCGLGQTGPNPVLSTLRYFREEFEAHILEKRCPAKRCVALLRFEIDPELCSKCGLCFKACPAEAIVWRKKEVARIVKDKCVKCLTCFDRCRFGAIG